VRAGDNAQRKSGRRLVILASQRLRPGPRPMSDLIQYIYLWTGIVGVAKRVVFSAEIQTSQETPA
jgi:hypothetical protein